MMKPSSKGHGAISKRIADGILVQNTNQNQAATATRQSSVRRKTSAEIANTVSSFIQDARAAKGASIRADSADPTKMKPKGTASSRTGLSRNEMLQRLMQGQKMPLKTSKVANNSSGGKNASSTATISFGKNVLKVESEKPLSKSRSEQRTTPGLQQPSAKQANRKNISSGVEMRKTASAVSARAAPVRRSSGKAVVLRDDQIGDKTHEMVAKKKSSILGRNEPAPKPNYYLTSSSSEDEDINRPSRDGGYEKPTSPASKAKMWNEIHKTPGPSFPGWKFRPPAHGRRLGQVGPEEFAETFKNLQTEVEKASKRVQAGEPRQNKFSDYMRKIKSSSKSRDADTTTAGLESNINLKKIYSDQLDAMREKALASIKSLDAETHGSDGDLSLEVVKDGVARKYRGLSSTDMLKNAVESLQQHRKESIKLEKSEPGTYLDRKAGYEFAKGDHLSRNELDRSKAAELRNPGPGSPVMRASVTKDEQAKMRKKESKRKMIAAIKGK